MDDLPIILIASFCLLIAIACCWFYFYQRRNLATWLHAEATITRTRNQSAVGSDGGNRCVYYEFHDRAGKSWTGLADNGPKDAVPGTKFEIAYNPEEPRASMSLSVSPVPLFFAAIAIFIGGLVIFTRL